MSAMSNVALHVMLSLVVVAGCGGDDDGVGSDAGGLRDATVSDGGGGLDAPATIDGGATGEDAAAPDGGVAADDGGSTGDGGGSTGDDGGTAPDAMSMGVACFPDPPIARGCGAAGDCIVVLHQIDCCGTFRAIGIAGSDRDRFDDEEALCEASYPRCRCAARPTEADDGSTGSAEPNVDCRAGVCTSSFL